MCLDRLREAEELAPEVRKRGLDGARIHQRFLEMAYLAGDPAAVAAEIQWFEGKPVEFISLGLQAADRNDSGQRAVASKLYQRAAETASRQGLENVAAEFQDADARAGALSGNCRTTHRLGRPALALALCGDTAQAEKVAMQTLQDPLRETNWNTVQLPEIHAATELKRDNPAKAVELLETASTYERGYPEIIYLRGLAYLRLKKGAEAAAEFQKILDHKGASWGATWVHPNWAQYYSAFLHRAGARGRVIGRYREGAESLRRFLQTVEASRSGCSRASRSEERLRSPALVVGRDPFHVGHHQHLDRHFASLDAQAVLLHCVHQGRRRIGRGCRVDGAHAQALGDLWRKRQAEIVEAFDARHVDQRFGREARRDADEGQHARSRSRFTVTPADVPPK